MTRLLRLAALLCCARIALSQGGLPPQPVPPGNAITTAKALLGKALFWDEQLSSTRMTACGTCHIPAHGMSDPRAGLHPGLDLVFGTADDKRGASPGPVASSNAGQYVSVPIFGLAPQVGTRRSRPTINSGFFSSLFWDGRVADPVFRDPITNAVVLTSGAQLENLVAEPPLNDFEMAHVGRTWSDVVARVQTATPLAASPALTADLTAFVAGNSYPDLFLTAFGTNTVTAARIVMAIATYQRTLVSDQSPFDDFRNGTGTLTLQEQDGLQLFQQFCSSCHSEPFFGGQLTALPVFFNTGVRPPPEDRGRFGVTNNPVHDGAFRVPSLRNVALRAPFFHNGGKATLEQVVDFYDNGGEFPLGPSAAALVFPLNLVPSERRAIVAFLHTLTDPRVAAELPPFDRPVLASDGNAPTLFGTAGLGSGGFSPTMISSEPPFAGNPEFRIGIDRARGNALALLVAANGAMPGGVPIGSATLFVDPTTAQVPVTLLTLGVGPGAGYGTVQFPVPLSLAGVDLFLQWVVLDPGLAGLLTNTEATAISFY